MCEENKKQMFRISFLSRSLKTVSPFLGVPAAWPHAAPGGNRLYVCFLLIRFRFNFRDRVCQPRMTTLSRRGAPPAAVRPVGKDKANPLQSNDF